MDLSSTRSYNARDVRRLIASIVGSLAFLMVVGVAAWIIISLGAGHPTWQ